MTETENLRLQSVGAKFTDELHDHDWTHDLS